MKPGGRSGALRRYPALAFLVVATVLAVALPSALTLPNAAPPTLAEFAPVPGSVAGAGGDLGRLGSGSSGAPGFGGGEPVAPGQPDLDPGQPGGSFKRCVGSPPRQTEDPLSPPCVAFFEGDNGGATARGVTADEVTVVVHQPPLAGTSQQPGTWVDYGTELSEEDPEQDFWLKTLALYFNDRYQTYGRTVHLWGLYGSTGTSAEVVAERRAEAIRADAEKRPFATISLAFNSISPYLRTATDRGMTAVAVDGFAREVYRSAAPRWWGVFPDLEDESALAAGYICRKLAGKNARHTEDPTVAGRPRRFGIVYSESEREPENAKLAARLKRDLERCGADVPVSIGASDQLQEAQADAATGIASLRSNEVTTVIVAARSQTILAFTGAATGAGWFPEWFIPGRRSLTGIDQAANARLLPQDQWRHAFGISFSTRWGDNGDMHWARAYQEACNGCELRGPYYFGAYAYDALQMLFYGIQASGPRLTTENFDLGMHAIPPRPSVNPFTPAAYFGSGNYGYIKDAMEIWWNPSGQAPGSEGATGCYVLPRGGRRFRANEWARSEAGLFEEGVCNGDAPVA